MATKQGKIGVRPETYRKFKRIAKQTRRTIAETADVLADDFLSRPSVVTDAHPSPDQQAGDTRSGESVATAK